jgi:LruC domain-containing protein
MLYFSFLLNLMPKYINVNEGSWNNNRSAPVPITITMPPVPATYDANNFSLTTWNPFIFINQKRGHELHLLDHPPTNHYNPNYFNTVDDRSNLANNKYYLSQNKLPWALDFPVEFQYPFEKKEITRAYLHFREWAESGGKLFTDWYTNTGAAYRETQYIYH